MKIETLPIEKLIPYARNSRTHSDEQVAQIAASVREFGWTNPVLIDAAGTIVAGHGRVMAARKLGMAEIPCIRLGHLTPAQVRAYVIADNKLALNAGWNDQMLCAELEALKLEGFEVELTGFSEDEIAALLKVEEEPPAANTDPDEVPVEASVPVTVPGDLWQLGRHRLICGDSTQADTVKRLFAGAGIDCILTDPPYCSGGFQEAGRASGSIGSAQIKKGGKFEGGIANDKLSTRGYSALMKQVLGLVDAPMLYAFTDWRMWINLYDISESSGFGVRNMIVWDKGTPGMGMGWRTQHELLLFGLRAKVTWDNHKALGNVIKSKRTGNKLHPTQKPVDLIEQVLELSEMANNVYDPFGGSGTTLMACETKGRSGFACELMPAFADVIVTRWQEFTGKEAVNEATGQTFNATKAKMADA